jgi:hypothetical protein
VAAPDAGAAAGKGGTNEIGTFSIVCRAVSLTQVSSDANDMTAFAVENELKSNPLFDGEGTRLTGTISPVEPPGTFTFPVTIKLKKPMKPWP